MIGPGLLNSEKARVSLRFKPRRFAAIARSAHFLRARFFWGRGRETRAYLHYFSVSQSARARESCDARTVSLGLRTVTVRTAGSLRSYDSYPAVCIFGGGGVRHGVPPLSVSKSARTRAPGRELLRTRQRRLGDNGIETETQTVDGGGIATRE